MPSTFTAVRLGATAAGCAVQALEDAGWWAARSTARIGLGFGVGAEWLVNWENDMHQAGNALREPHADGRGSRGRCTLNSNCKARVHRLRGLCQRQRRPRMARQWIRRAGDIVLAGAAERSITPMSVGCSATSAPLDA